RRWVLRYRAGQHRPARGGLERAPPDRAPADRARRAGGREGREGADRPDAGRQGVRGFVLDGTAHARDGARVARGRGVRARRLLSLRLRGSRCSAGRARRLGLMTAEQFRRLTLSLPEGGLAPPRAPRQLTHTIEDDAV